MKSGVCIGVWGCGVWGVVCVGRGVGVCGGGCVCVWQYGVVVASVRYFEILLFQKKMHFAETINVLL